MIDCCDIIRTYKEDTMKRLLCLIAFVLYTAGLTLAYINTPENFHINMPLRLIILLALIKGVHSGWKYQNYQRLKEVGEIV